MTSGELALLKWTAELSGVAHKVDRLGSALLCQTDRDRPHQGRSTLNNDGSPLQVCVTYDASRCRIRVVGDPGANVSNANRRFAMARRALADILTVSDAVPLTSICDGCLNRLLPVDKGRDDLQAGAMWLAAGVDGGAALYVNTRWGQASERWDDALAWLGDILPCSRNSEPIIRTLRRRAWLVSAGVEGRSAADARAKIYWRLQHPIALADLGVPLLTHEAIGEFLGLFGEEQPIALSGLVFSAGFSLRDGAICDTKVDVCGHCVPRSPGRWLEMLGEYCQRQRLQPLHIGGAAGHPWEIAFVGFGVTAEERRRLNVYLKARTSN
jgi:hypothetical protein